MILESLVTTLDARGAINFAPMGPHFDPQSSNFELRPFNTSHTYQNLMAIPSGVLHVTDDVLLFARAAINQFRDVPKTRPASMVRGAILDDCCRWYEFKTIYIDSTGPRISIQCEIVEAGRNRDFYGFNRAKHAVIEAAILATRVNFLPIEEIRVQIERLATIVNKTGGDNEARAYALLDEYVRNQQPIDPSNSSAI